MQFLASNAEHFEYYVLLDYFYFYSMPIYQTVTLLTAVFMTLTKSLSYMSEVLWEAHLVRVVWEVPFTRL